MHRFRRRATPPIILSVVMLLSTGVAAAAPTPSVSNLQLLGYRDTVVPLEGGRLAFAVTEADNGHRDLNGDGDDGDTVVHIWDPATGSTANLGLSISSRYSFRALVPLNDGSLAFGVSEALQGADLNGDGDTSDTVVHVWAPGAGTTDVGLAVLAERVCCSWDVYELVALDGGGVAFSVPEAAQGNLDRNRDGDTTDNVVHAWKAAGTPAVNLGLAGRTLVPLAGGGLAVLVEETRQHKTDLNADGDARDKVVHLWNPGAVQVIVDLNLAAVGLVPLDNGGLAVFVVESSQHGRDLNGDGDANDTVVHIWDAASAATRNLGLAVRNTTNRSAVALDKGRLGFRVFESQQGGRDLDGDGDAVDSVVHIWDPGTATVTNLGRDGNDLVALRAGGLAFNAGSRLYVWEPAKGTTTAVGFRGNGIVHAMAGGGVAFGVAEGSAKRDLNGDGDADDTNVLHIWDPVTRATTNLGLVGEGIPLEGGGFGFGVAEYSQGVDLTGDGDASDVALHVWDKATGTTNLHIAGNPVAALIGNSFAFLVQEGQQGYTDLNGDGDTLDQVVHVVRL